MRRIRSVGEAAVPDWVQREARRFVYPDFDTVPPSPQPPGGSGGDPTIFIACADATPQSKAMAHFVATGVDDHGVYETALGILLTDGPAPGGRIVISEGTFHVDPNEMVVTDIAHLHGLGAFRTQIVNQIDGTSTDALVEVQTDGELSDIGFNTTSTYAGRAVLNNYGRIANIWHAGGASVGLYINGAQHPIDNIQVDGAYTDAGVVVNEGWVIMNNVISLRSSTAAGGACMRITDRVTSVTTISNLVVSHNVSGVGHGIVLEGAAQVVLSGFAIAVPGDSAVFINDDVPSSLVLTDGYLEGDYGIRSSGFPGLNNSKLSQLLINPDLIGIDLELMRESTIDDVTILTPGEHGVRLVDSSDNTLSNIYILEPGRDADDTYDGVILEGNSDRNDLRQVRVIGIAAGNQPRWAVNISAATCDDNSYLDCRSGPAANYGLNGGATTTPYNDAGTGTINTWPGAAAPQGDNLL